MASTECVSTRCLPNLYQAYTRWMHVPLLWFWWLSCPFPVFLVRRPACVCVWLSCKWPIYFSLAPSSILPDAVQECQLFALNRFPQDSACGLRHRMSVCDLMTFACKWKTYPRIWQTWLNWVKEVLMSEKIFPFIKDEPSPIKPRPSLFHHTLCWKVKRARGQDSGCLPFFSLIHYTILVMSTVKNRTHNRRGRPRRNNATSLQQHHLKEKALAPDALFDLDEDTPLTIVQPAKKAPPPPASSPLAALPVDTFDGETPAVTERDSITSASTTQHPINSEATLSVSPCSSLTDTNVIASELSELSSEDDSINATATPSSSPPPPPPKQTSTVNTSQGVDLDQLPKVHFVKGNVDEDNGGLHGDQDEDEDIYQQEQLAQEEQLLIQHYQAQQQSNPSSSTLASNSNDILKLSCTFNRPENHYIHYNELSDVELYDSVEYDMDEQDQCWLRLYNKERRKELAGDISPYLFECIMDKLEKEWFNLVSLSLLGHVIVLVVDDLC